MLQILQDLKNGETQIMEVPVPMVKRGQVLIQTHASLISVGTEKMLVDFGKGNLLQKARQQPDKVRMVLEKVKTDGLKPTLDAVLNKLEQPMPLGYCNAGVVLAVGEGVTQFQPGDRVVSNGCHAEVVSAPVNLCAKIPDAVSFEDASFTVIGSIALQGIRLAEVSLGDSVAVVGLGLVGLTCVQLLQAAGCRVFGLDFNSERCAMAQSFGAETFDLSLGGDPVSAGMAFSRERGMDSVIITASTDSDQPMRQAANMSRKRGKIVLVGVAGLNLSRADFYEKELTFQVSASYGPGRYDANYEDRGQDYPVGFVRWTAQRNFEAVLDMLASKRMDSAGMITDRVAFEEAGKAYHSLGASGSLGIVLNYNTGKDHSPRDHRTLRLESKSTGHEKAIVGLIGAGVFAKRHTLPNLKAAAHVAVKACCSSQGLNATLLARKFGIETATTDVDQIFRDPQINTLVVTTPNSSHAGFVKRAIAEDKAIFVEKPLCITREEMAAIEEVYDAASNPRVMIGFNRRFAPHIVKLKALLDVASAPCNLVMTVNAGSLPPGHWTGDPAISGGRIVGEACHFVDLVRFLADSPIVSLKAVSLGNDRENMTLTMVFENGSSGIVHYLGNGHKSFPKERLEVFCNGGIIQLDNFRKMKGFGWPGFSSMKLVSQDKGHKTCMTAFVEAVRDGKPMPIPFNEILEVANACFSAVEDAAAMRPLAGSKES